MDGRIEDACDTGGLEPRVWFMPLKAKAKMKTRTNYQQDSHHAGGAAMNEPKVSRPL